MSDCTFGYVISRRSALGLEPPVQTLNRGLARAVSSGYGYVLRDVAELVRPPAALIASHLSLRRAENNIQQRAVRLAALSNPQLARPTDRIRGSSSQPLSRPSEWLDSAPHSNKVLRGQSTHVGPAPLILAAASPAIRRSHELLARAELACARAEVIIPRAHKANILRQRLGAADATISTGDVDRLARSAEEVAHLAAELERDLAEATARRTVEARSAADALARAGALWIGIHSQDGLIACLSRERHRELEQAEQRLRLARAAYEDERFDETAHLARTIETGLAVLIDSATEIIATGQRDANATEAEGTLRGMGYETRTSLVGERRVVVATLRGITMMEVSFDREGRFEIDSRAGHQGPTCAVEVNRFLKMLGEKLGLEIESRTYVGRPDLDPGMTAVRSSRRRRLAAAEMLGASSGRVSSPPVPPKAAVAAWSRLSR